MTAEQALGLLLLLADLQVRCSNQAQVLEMQSQRIERLEQELANRPVRRSRKQPGAE